MKKLSLLSKINFGTGIFFIISGIIFLFLESAEYDSMAITYITIGIAIFLSSFYFKDNKQNKS